MISIRKLLSITAILSLVFSPVTPAVATPPETYVWSGGAGPGDTSLFNNANWEGGQYPLAPTDNIIFASGGVTATDDSFNFEMASITFDSAVDFSVTSGFAGSSLQINEGGITAENSAGGDRTYTVSQDITLGASQTWTVSNSGLDTTVLAVSGAIDDGGHGYGLTKTDDGTLTLSGANTYSGDTTVTGGTLNLDYSTQNNSKLSDTAALALGGGTLNLTGGSHTEVVASTTFDPGASSVTRSSGTSVLQMNALSSSIGSTVNFGAVGIATTDKTNTHGILGGWATVGGTDWAMNSTNAADGAITAYAGYTNDFWLGAGDNTTVTNNATVVGCTTNSLRFNKGGAYTLTLASTNTITSGGILVTSNVGNNLNTITGGALQGASGEDLVVMQNNTSNGLTIGSVIQDNTSTTGLTKSGAGTLTLTGTNTYTGTTYVNEGTLTITNSSALGSIAGGVVVADGGILKLDGSGGDIDVGAEDLSLYGPSGYELGALYSASGNNSWAGDITLTGNAGVEAASGSTLALTGDITGDYNLGKFGEGEVTLSGNNTYTGATKLASGTLNINSDTALGTGILLINSGATLDNTSGSAITLVNNNDQHWESDFTFKGTNDLDLGTGDVDISNAAVTITVEDSNLTVGGIISDGGEGHGLTKTGSGTLAISGANTYTGATTISAGTLQIGDGGTTGSLSTSSAIINNGTLSFQRTNTVTQGTDFASVMSGTGGVTQEDSGTLILNGDNAYTGVTTVRRAGTLNLDFSAAGAPDDDIINSSSALVLGGGSLLLTGSGLHDTIQSFAGTTLNSGASNVTLENDSHDWFLDLDLGEISTNAGSTLNFSGLVAGGDYGNYAWTTTELDDSGILGAWATVNGTDYATLAYDGWLPGNYVLAYTAYTNIDAYGSVILDGAHTNVRINTAAGAAGSPITLGVTTDPSGWFTINTLLQNTTVATTVDTASGAGSLDVSGIMIGEGMGSLTIGVEPNDSSLYAATQNGEIVLINHSALGALTINASIGEWTDPVASSSLVKSGAGEVILNGTNLYTGTTYVNEGTLTITNSSALGTTAGGVVVADGGILKLDGSEGDIDVGAEALSLNGPSGLPQGALYSASGDNSWAGAITLTGNAGVEAASGSTLTLTSNITGDYVLGKYGDGEITLSGNNTYTGGTQLVAGTLNINSATALGTGTLAIYNSTTIDNTSGSAITLVNNNDQAWESAFTFTGTNDLNLGTGDVDMSNGNVTITVGNSNLTVGGIINDDENGVSQGHSLTKTGSGTLTLSSSNTYTGRTRIGGGTVYLTADQTNTWFTFIYGVDAYTDEHTLLKVANGVNITGDITNYGDYRGTLTFEGSSIMNGRVGDYSDGGSLLQMNVGTAGSTVTFKKDIGAYDIHFTSTTTDGTIILEDGVDYHALYNAAFITTETDGLGILKFLGSSEVDATVGVSGASLNKIDVAQGKAEGGYSVSLDGDVHANQLNFGLATEGFDTTVSFLGTAHIGDGGITTEWNLRGTVYFASNATIDGQVGAEGSYLSKVYAAQGGDHRVDFNGDVYLNNLEFYTDAEPDSDATVTFNSNASIDRGITTDWDLYGIVNFNGNATVTSYFPEAIGSDGARLWEVNFLGAAATSSIGKDVYADQVLADTGTVDFAGNVYTSFLVLESGAMTGDGILTSDYEFDLRSGSISNTLAGEGDLYKTTSGTVTLTGANTYTGATTVSGGTLTLSGADGAIASSSGVTISGGSTLTLNNTAAANNGNRIGAVGIAMNGGTLNFSNDNSASTFTETLGGLTLGLGENTISSSQAIGGTSTLTFASLTRTAGTVNFSGTGLGADAQNRILFTASPTLGTWATYNDAGYATYDADRGVIEASYTDIAALGSTIAHGPFTNVRINSLGSGGNIALGTDTTTIQTLLQNFTTASTVATAGKTFRTGSIMIAEGKAALTIGAAAGDGTLTAATTGGELILINNSALNDLTINAVIADNGTASSLTTAGAGVVNLKAANTYTGATNVSDGVLNLFESLTASSGLIFAGDAIVNLAASKSIACPITTKHDGLGTLAFEGDGEVTGQVGAADAYLKAISVVQGGNQVTLGGDVYANQLNFGPEIEAGADTTVTFNGDAMIGQGNSGDGITTGWDEFGVADFYGNAVVSGERDGAAYLAAIGAAGKYLWQVNFLGDVTTTATVNGDIYAEQVAVDAGTLRLNGSLHYNGNPDWHSGFLADGFITVGDDGGEGYVIEQEIRTNNSGQGTLSFLGNATVEQQVGVAAGTDEDSPAARYLKAINANGEGTLVDLQGDVLANALNFGGDGEVQIGGTANLGTVSNTSGANDTGTLTFLKDATVTGQVGAQTAYLKTINMGQRHEDGADAAYAVNFNKDVYADFLNFGTDPNPGGSFETGWGTVATFNGNAYVNRYITTEWDNYGTVIFNGNATLNGKIGDVYDAGTGSGELWKVYFNSGQAVINEAIHAQDVYVTGNTTLGLSSSFEANEGLIDGNVTLEGTSTLDVVTNSLNVTGDYMQGSGTTLALALVSATTSGNVDVGGTTTVASGSKVSVTVPTGFTIANGTPFTILTVNDVAANEITAPAVTSNTRRYAFTASVDPVTHDLVITSAQGSYEAPAGATGDESAVANALNSITNPAGDMANVLDQLGTLSDSAYDQALDTMHPNVSSGAAEGSRSLTSQGFSTVSNRLGGARNGGSSSSGISSGDMLNGVGVWMQALGSHIQQDMRKGIEGYMGNLFGTTIGADKVIDDHFRAGFAGSYGWARMKSKTAGSPSDDINSYQGTIYGSFDSLDLNKARQGGKKSYEAVRSQVEDSWYVDGMLSVTQNNYDSRREIWLGGASKRVAKADHYGQQYSTNFETGYKFVFEKTKKLEITPFASLGYNYLYMNQYKEDGANALNLMVNGKGFHQLEQSLGTKLAYPIVAKKVGTFIPSAKAAWLYDYMGDRFETTASFAGGGSSFNTQGAKPAKNGMLFGAELVFLNKGNMTLTGNWDITLKDQFMSNTYYGTVRYDF